MPASAICLVSHNALLNSVSSEAPDGQLTKNAEEESSCEKAGVAFHQALHDCDKAKQHHISSEPHVWCEFLHQHICRDLE
jgi:hypothetical protein